MTVEFDFAIAGQVKGDGDGEIEFVEWLQACVAEYNNNLGLGNFFPPRLKVYHVLVSEDDIPIDYDL